MAAVDSKKGSSPSPAHQQGINDAWKGGPENGNTNAGAMAGQAFDRSKRDVSPQMGGGPNCTDGPRSGSPSSTPANPGNDGMGKR